MVIQRQSSHKHKQTSPYLKASSHTCKVQPYLVLLCLSPHGIGSFSPRPPPPRCAPPKDGGALGGGRWPASPRPAPRCGGGSARTPGGGAVAPGTASAGGTPDRPAAGRSLTGAASAARGAGWATCEGMVDHRAAVRTKATGNKNNMENEIRIIIDGKI